jgi:hypothetical protein
MKIRQITPAIGAEISIDARGRIAKARIVETPFYQRSY